MANRNETSLSEFALTKARDYILNTISQADGSLSLGVGSAIRSLLVLPSSVIYAGVMNDIESLRLLHLGNYNQISQGDMDLLATNYFVERPEGSTAFTNLKVYISDVSELEGTEASRRLIRFSYFRNPKTGMNYMPLSPKVYGPEDASVDEDGIYITVPVEAVSVGVEGRALSGEIVEWNQMPFTVLSVTNPDDTTGGDPRAGNEDFFEVIAESINDGTLTQEAGFRSFINRSFDRGDIVEIVDTGDPLMMRDELWVDENGVPNLDRNGIPYAAHVDLGEVNFDLWSGRAVATNNSIDLESLVGKRIAIPGDPEVFRTILSASNSNRSLMVSGDDLYGTYQNVVVWNEAMHIGNMADIYMHPELLDIESQTVSNIVEAFFENIITNSGFTFLLPVTSELQDLRDGDYYSIVIKPGQDDSISLIGNFSISQSNDIVDYPEGFNNSRYTFTFLDEHERIFSLREESMPTLGDNIYIFRNSSIKISREDGEITGTPVIHVLDIKSVDPVSGESLLDDNGNDIGDIPQTKPGNYDPPGWYFRNTDPANLLSTLEEKMIVIDEKRDSPAFYPHNATGYATTSRVTGDPNTVQLPVQDLSGCEGRLVNVTVQESELQVALANYKINSIPIQASVDPLNPSILNLQGLGQGDDIEYFIGYYEYLGENQPTVTEGQPLLIQQFDSLNNPLSTIGVVGRGTRLFADVFGPTSGFDPSVDYISVVSAGLDGDVNSPFKLAERVFENSIIMRVDASNVEVLLGYDELGQENKLIVKHNDLPEYGDVNFSGYNISSNVNIQFQDERASWTSGSIEVVYATSLMVRNIQTVFENEGVRNVCTNTIARSVFPSLIDTSFNYFGSLSPTQIQARFVSLVGNAEASTSDEENSVRIDMSNIISSLDTDTLSDFIETDFEIRVTDHLPDGEYQVRYMNPSLSTRQAMSLSPYAFVTDPNDPDYGQPLMGTPLPIGSDRVTVRKLFPSSSGTLPIPSRGKIYMGGANESVNEIIPYEAVIAKNQEEFILIFRGGFETTKLHYPYETVIVAARDYDPALEMKGYLTVPKINRPYVRQVVAKKLQNTEGIVTSNPYDPFFKGFK